MQDYKTFALEMTIKAGKIIRENFSLGMKKEWKENNKAGGKVTDLFGNEQSYTKEIKGFIASNGKIHDQLLRLVKSSI